MWKSWDGKINQNSFITAPELITLCCLISFRHPSSQSTNSMSKFWTNQEISFWQQFWFLRQLEIWFPRFGVVHFWNPPGRAPLLLPALCPISWRARGKPMGKPGKLKKLPNITLPFSLLNAKTDFFSLIHNSSRDKSPLQRLSFSSWMKSHSSLFFSQQKRFTFYLSKSIFQPAKPDGSIFSKLQHQLFFWRQSSAIVKNLFINSIFSLFLGLL